jgi:hypothetical protein
MFCREASVELIKLQTVEAGGVANESITFDLNPSHSQIKEQPGLARDAKSQSYELVRDVRIHVAAHGAQAKEAGSRGALANEPIAILGAKVVYKLSRGGEDSEKPIRARLTVPLGPIECEKAVRLRKAFGGSCYISLSGEGEIFSETAPADAAALGAGVPTVAESKPATAKAANSSKTPTMSADAFQDYSKRKASGVDE